VVNYGTDPTAAEEVAHAVEAPGGRAITFNADVSCEDQVAVMFVSAHAEFGTLQIVEQCGPAVRRAVRADDA
jgi:hypothetical protein